MDNISYSLNIDVTSQLLSYDVYVASKNDTNIRNINIALFENGNTVQLSENASATASFVTDNVLIDDGVVCTINGNVITVPLTDLQQHGNLDIQVTVTDGSKILATPYPIQVKVTPNIAETAQIDENSMGSYAEVVHEIATARDGYNNLDERLDSMTSESAATYERLANKSQTINPTNQNGDDVSYPSVYAARSYTNSKVDNLKNYVDGEIETLDSAKADAATTYTKTETDSNISQAAARKESLSNKVQSINENTSADDNDNYPSVYAARSYTNSKFTNLKNYVDGEVHTLNSAKADKTDVYTKTQVYTQAEANGRFEVKSNKVTEITAESAAGSNNYPSATAVKNYVDGEVRALNSAKADKSEVYTKEASDEKFEVNTNKAVTIYPDPREGESNYYTSVTAVRNYVGSRYIDMTDYVDGELDSLGNSIQEELNGKEDKANKVTEIIDGSTADQYPTATAVKNYVDGEVTALDSAKADKSDVYTKAAANIKFEDKANKATEITDGSTANQYPTATAVKNYVDGEVTAIDEAKADKADTNAQFERLIAVLQNKAGKAETLAGYGINDAYTKAEVNALIGISKIDIGEAQITIDDSTFVYDGNSHVPNVTSVVLNNVQLTYGVDYAVIATPATNAGDYVITVNGIGDYDGTATVNWYISKAQAIINGDESITIRGIGESVTKTYTTNGDGAFSFTASGGVATVTNVDGAVTVTSTEIGSGILTVTVAEGQNYLSAEKTVNITVQEAVTATVFGVMWDYSLSSPELTRLTQQTDPLGVVTNVPTQEPTACIGTEGGQSDFDNYMPWAGIQRFNYVNGQIVDFVDYTNGETYVYIPEFWSKIVDDSENSKMYFYISDSELNGFTKHLGSGRYIGRYACDVNFEAKPNGIPKHKTSLSNFRNGVVALGTPHYLNDIHCFSAIVLLYIIEFANLNSQAVIGEGITNVSEIQSSGLTDSLIYHTGRASGINAQSAVQYRWIENLWGNVSEYIDGILTSGVKVYFCDDYVNYGDSVNTYYYDTNLELPNLTNEFIKNENCYRNGYLLPKTVGASSDTFVCDRIFIVTGTRVMRVGGAFNALNSAGLFAVIYSDSPTDSPTNSCARPILILNNGGNE